MPTEARSHNQTAVAIPPQFLGIVEPICRPLPLPFTIAILLLIRLGKMRIFSNRRGWAERNREDQLKSIREELMEKRSVPKDPEKYFVTTQVIGEILTITKIRVIFTGLDVDDYLGTIMKYLRQVLTILIMIKWTGWPSFKTIFLSFRGDSECPDRGDHLLPFSDLTFLSEDFREDFEKEQYICKPILIVENSHNSYSGNSRLPFLESEKVGYGGYGEVMRVRVERNQIVYTSGVYRGDFNCVVSFVYQFYSSKPITNLYFTKAEGHG